jgi:hypothetical protein
MGKGDQIVRRKAGLTCSISHLVGSSSRPKPKLNQPTPRPSVHQRDFRRRRVDRHFP